MIQVRRRELSRRPKTCFGKYRDYEGTKMASGKTYEERLRGPVRKEDAAGHRNHLYKKAKANVIPVRQRTQYSCMSASMCMALRAHGVQCTEDEVNRVMGARAMQGASWENALACAQHYGFRTTLVTPSTVRQLKEWTDAGDPVMIAWNPEGRDWSHASLVFDVDDDLNVYIADPNIPDPDETVRVVPKGEFYKKWFEKWPNYLVRRPACAIQREITVDGRQVFANKTSRFQSGTPEVSLVRDGVEVALPVSEGVALKDVRDAVPELTKHVRRIAEVLKSEFSEVRPLGWVLLKNPSRFVERIQVTGSKSRQKSLLRVIKSLHGIQFKRASVTEFSPEEVSLVASRIANRHISRKSL